jgi:hypothetical protein
MRTRPHCQLDPNAELVTLSQVDHTRAFRPGYVSWIRSKIENRSAAELASTTESRIRRELIFLRNPLNILDDVPNAVGGFVLIVFAGHHGYHFICAGRIHLPHTARRSVRNRVAGFELWHQVSWSKRNKKAAICGFLIFLKGADRPRSILVEC